MRRYWDTFRRYWYIALIPVIVLPLAVYRLDKGGRSRIATATQYILANQAVLSPLSAYNGGQTPAQNEATIIGQFLRDPLFDQAIESSAQGYYAQVIAGRNTNAVTDLSTNVQVSALGYNLVSVSYSSDTGDTQLAGAVVQSVLSQADYQTVAQQQGLYGVQRGTLVKQLTAAQQQMSGDDKVLLGYLRKRHFGFTADAIAQQMFYDPTLTGYYQQVQIDQGTINSIQGSIRDIQNKLAALPTPTLRGLPTTFTLYSSPPPTVTNGPNKKLIDLLVALALGLLLGGGFVVVRTALDRSLRSADDVPQLLDLPVLGVVPHAPQQPGARRGRGNGGDGGYPPSRIRPGGV